MNIAAVASAQMVHAKDSRDWLSQCQRLPTPHGLAGYLLSFGAMRMIAYRRGVCGRGCASLNHVNAARQWKRRADCYAVVLATLPPTPSKRRLALFPLVGEAEWPSYSTTISGQAKNQP
jgi:hypothetical protein